MTDRRFRGSVAAIWGVVAVLMIAVAASAIAHGRFPDPDDQMRLLEVRDWLAGQSWFDVTQYRLNAPAGVPMHWSRLVDLPIAAVILASRPLLGTPGAEQLALVLVPLITLAAVLAPLAVLSRRLLADDEQTLMALCVALLSTEILHQLRPMRIDHHGWQMVCAVVAAGALVGRPTWRAGALAGIAVAVWLSISLEGLPMCAAILTLVALRWAFEPACRALLVATTAATAAATLAIYAASHSGAAWHGSVCDAVSPVYLAMLGVAAVGSTVVTALPLRSRVGRLAALAILGLVTLGPLPMLAPSCEAGPFARLDPLVRHFWYLNVMEGLPAWLQEPATIVNTIALPLVGLFGAGAAFRSACGSERERWAVLLFLLGAATLAAIVTQRSGGVANLLAAPAVVHLLYPLLRRARAVRDVPKRTLATFGIFLLAAPGIAAGFVVKAVKPLHAGPSVAQGAAACEDASDMRAMRRLPIGNVLAPLDVSPAILVFTPLGAVASGHHRGVGAMHDVIAAFTGTDAVAHAIVKARRLTYVAFCPGLPEIAIYEDAAPSGFLAQLDRGRSPAWLERITLPRSLVKVWRVR